MHLFGRRLVTRSLLLSQVAALGLVSSMANAAVISSGTLNIAIPNTIDGLYVNVVTATTTGTPPLAGWDLNPYATGGNLTFFTSTAAANNNQVVGSGTVITALTPGTVVGPASTYATAGAVSTAATAFRNTGTAFAGFRFTRESDSTLHYGWAEFTTTAATGFPATLVRYAWDDTPNTAITIPGGTTAPTFAYTPAAGGTVNFTGGGAVGSTGSASITVAVATPGSGTGAGATTTTTCTAPTAPFAGFGQSVTAVGTGAATGGPLTGTCTLGAAAATQTLTCSENRGGTPTAVTFQLSCPAGTVAPVTSNPVSGSTLAFGNISVGGSATRTVTFTNPGAAAATVTCTAPAAPFSASPLSIPVPAGGSASTTVTFTGTAVGNFTGTLNCTAGATAFTFPITGGVTPAATAQSVPALGDTGRWIAILMLLGIGLAAVAVRRN